MHRTWDLLAKQPLSPPSNRKKEEVVQRTVSKHMSAPLRRVGVCLLGLVVTEKVLVPLSSHLTARLLAALCARERELRYDGTLTTATTAFEGGYYCSTIPFARRLVSLALRSIVYAMMLGRQLGIDVQRVLSGVGVGGLMVGWALQKVLQDAVSGALIVATQQPFRVGDVVTIRNDGQNFSGKVDRLTLSHTVLSDGAGPGDDVGGGGGDGDGGSTTSVLVPNHIALKAVVRVRR